MGNVVYKFKMNGMADFAFIGFYISDKLNKGCLPCKFYFLFNVKG